MHRLKALVGRNLSKSARVKGTCVDDELKRSREFTRGLLSSTYYGTAAGEPKANRSASILDQEGVEGSIGAKRENGARNENTEIHA